MCDKNNVILERFQELIKDSGKTRQAIAQDIGCDTSTVTKQFNGDMNISVDYLVKYARYFGVSADYLLGLTGSATTNKDIQFICDYTGLSVEAVNHLRLAKESSQKREYDKEYLMYYDFSLWYGDEFDISTEFDYLIDYLEIKEKIQEVEQCIVDVKNIEADHAEIIQLALRRRKLKEKLEFFEYKFSRESQLKLELYLMWKDRLDKEKIKQIEKQAKKTIDEIEERYWCEYARLSREEIEDGD